MAAGLFMALPPVERFKLVAWAIGKAWNMDKVRDFLKGKKTYITAAVGILGAVAAWSDGQINGVGLAMAVWAALQTCFIRAGIGSPSASS